MKNIFTLLFGIILFINVNAQTPQLNWDKIYNGPASGTDRITDMDFDPVTGNTYVTGVSDTSVGFNYVTMKYSPTGQVIWRKRYSGPQYQDSPNAIKYDPVNNAVYVTGKSKGLTTNFDWLTIRYNDETGDMVWTKRYNGTFNSNDEAIDLDIDANGNIYVVGNVLEDCTAHLNAKIINYSATGNVTWSTSIPRYTINYCVYDFIASKVAVNGNKVVVIYKEIIASKYSAFAIGFLTDGSYTDPFGTSYVLGSTTDASATYDIDFDGSGYVYTTGSNLTSNADQIQVTKLNTDVHAVVWTKQYMYASGATSWANSLIVDQNNFYVYVTGYYKKSGGNNDIITFKLNASGDSLWSKKYNGIGNGEDMGMFITKDNLSNPNIFITGYTTQASGKKQITTLKYDNNGNQVWSFDYGCSTNDNTPEGMFKDQNNNFYIAGYNNCNKTNEDFVTMRYCPPPPPKPGTITGNTTVCTNTSQSYSIDPVTGATSYIWTLPNGSSGTSTTESITVNFGSSAVSGNITVKGHNECFDGPASTLAVVANKTPKEATITQNGNILRSSVASGNQWYFENDLIYGATNQDYTPTSDGNHYVIVTVNGCSSDKSNTISFVFTGFELSDANNKIKVYPNPVTNELTIEIKENTKKTDFEILNSLGSVVFKGNLVEKTVVQTSVFSPGMYLLKFENGKTFEFKKLIKK